MERVDRSETAERNGPVSVDYTKRIFICWRGAHKLQGGGVRNAVAVTAMRPAAIANRSGPENVWSPYEKISSGSVMSYPRSQSHAVSK
jgi:hypothetical protein